MSRYILLKDCTPSNMIRNKCNNQKGEGNFPEHLKFDEKLLGQFVKELEEVVLMLWFNFVLV